jgi:arylsulfatase A-like enzyme
MFRLNRRAHFQFGLAVLFLMSVAVCRVSATLPYFDPFATQDENGGTSYAIGSALAGQTNAGNFWVSIGSANATTVEPLISEGNLSYSNLPTPTGNSISFFSSAGKSARLNLNALVNSGRIYYSFVLKITDISSVSANATDNYISCFSDDPNPQANLLARAGARLVSKKVGAGYVFGIGKSSAPADYAYDTTVHNANETVFIVASYERVGSSTIANLWINPSDFGSATAPAPTITCTSGTTGDLSALGVRAFVIACQSASAPAGILDELRIGTDWPSVTGGLSNHRPNVIFILADDLGYGDLGVLFQNSRASGLPKEVTPNLDAFAAEGIQLRQHYCPAPLCAPSRASLLLGVHQGHANVRNDQFEKELANNHTIANVLQTGGYETAAIGKWGLRGNGSSPADWSSYPTRRGFDYYFGYVRHGDGHEHYPKEGLYAGVKECYDGTTNITPVLDKCYTADLFTARAKKWIIDHQSTNSSAPFFLYLAFDTPHSVYELPTQAYPSGGGTNGGLQWLGTPGHMINTASGTVDSFIYPEYANATYDDDNNPGTPEVAWPEVFKRFASSVRRIDDAVGDLKKLLQDLNIETNTMMIFTSDNGPTIEDALNLPTRYAANFFDNYGPFDGIKRDTFEGGIRMPTFVRWPGKIPAGVISQTPSQFQDWMPTFAELAGLPSPAVSDGASLMHTLTGVGAQLPSTIYVEYFYDNSTPDYAEFEPAHRNRKRGQMQVIGLNNLRGVRYDINSANDDFEIYDVTHDLKQATNLALNPAYAEIQQRMKERVLQLRRPNSTAPRPYDDELVPSVSASSVTAGVEWKAFAQVYPWVPELTQLTASSNGTTNRPTIAVRPRDNNFGLLFTGYLFVPTDGDYTFYLSADTGALLRIHDATVIDEDYAYGSGTETSGAIKLKAGLHPFRLYYARQEIGIPTLNFSWSGPGFAKQPVPDSAFRRDGIGPSVPPTALDDIASTSQRIPVSLELLANDFDDGSPAPLTIVSVENPKAGSVTTNAGEIIYTPNSNFLGDDNFNYTITDGETTATATARIKVFFSDGSYWFPFNQTSGLTTEEAGGGATASLLGFADDPAQWVTGKFNRAIQFNVSPNEVVIDGFKGITGKNPRTVSAWIKTSETQKSIGIVSWGDLPSGQKWSLLVQNTTAPKGTLRLELGYGNTIAGTPVNDGQWHHVACVLDDLPVSTSMDVKFYVDGQLDSVVSGAPVAINTVANNDVLIGCDIQNRFFNGVIDEVRIFNRALSAAEIDALYHATNEIAAAWHRRYFGNAPIDWNTDDDADGISNLGEYAFGGQPWIADADAMKIFPEISGNHLQVRFNRRISGMSELIYELQQSSDLVHWTTLAGTEISVEPLDAISGIEEVTFRADLIVLNQAASFIRISVRLP